MRALVKPATEPYKEIIPESSWGKWITAHLDKYISMGWTIIENYQPNPSNDDIGLI